MNTASSRLAHSELARSLIRSGLLDLADLDQLGCPSSGRLLDRLLASGRLTAAQIADHAASTFGLPRIEASALESSEEALTGFDERWLEHGDCLPLAVRGNSLMLATADPSQHALFDEIAFGTGRNLELVVAEAGHLQQAVGKLRDRLHADAKRIAGEALALDLAQGHGESELLSDAGLDVEDAPVVRFLQGILSDAVRKGASDIHFEPYEHFYRIRFRQDGVLHEVAQPPLNIRDRLASRIKVISRLNIAERRLPQDGRVKLSLSDGSPLELRVSTLPTLFGEKIVLRLLRSSMGDLDIDKLGLEPEQRETLLTALARPHGMLLVTGPTGSGKTVTLYTLLARLNENGINIATAEDPAEIYLPGVNQVNVNEKTGLTFAAALRAFLRQDPDTLMVGEIRDLETADIAIKAAQTGHRVLSTLHTNDAPGTLARLMNMGIAPFNVASSVNLITAQRLIRRLCTHCAEPDPRPPDVLRACGFGEDALDGTWQPLRARGCEHCNHTGFRGRVGIHQVMPVSDALARIIMAGGNTIELADQARREGVWDLHRAGLAKVRAGVTALTEVEALLHE